MVRIVFFLKTGQLNYSIFCEYILRVFATTTTVGYGDLYPTTTLGRIMGVFVMNLGILGFALPVTVIGANFTKIFLHEEEMIKCDDRRKSIVQIKHEENFKIKEIKKTVLQLQEHLNYLSIMLEAQEKRLEILTTDVIINEDNKL